MLLLKLLCRASTHITHMHMHTHMHMSSHARNAHTHARVQTHATVHPCTHAWWSAAGTHHGAGVVRDESLYVWGANTHGQLGTELPGAVLVASHPLSQEVELPQVSGEV